MGIYGTMVLNKPLETTSTILEDYIDNSFLESVLNESSSFKNFENSINELKKKDKIEDKDIKNLTKELKSIQDEHQKKRAFKIFIDFAAMMIGYGLVIASPTITISIAALCAEIISGFKLCIDTNPEEVEYAYYKIMQYEAKAKVNKKKAEKLGESKEELKRFDDIIDLCEKLKKARKDALVGKDKKEESANESVVLEYKGNDVKNEIFIQVLEDVDDICKMNIDKINIYENALNDMLSLMKKSSNASSIKDNLVKSRNIGRDTGKKIQEIKGYYGPLTFNLVKSEVKKFNNKYSEITMSEKKKLAEKLSKYKDKLQSIGKKYSANSEFFKEYIKILDKIESQDVAARNSFADLADSWVNAIIYEINATIADIDFVLKELNIEKTENSIIYKALNFRSK